MVTVKRLEIQVDLLSLTLGRIDIKRLVLIQPDILIETDRSGRSNLSFEGGRQSVISSSKRMRSAAGPLKLPALTAEEVNIEHGQVVYRDGKTGKSETVEILRLTAGADSAGSPIHLRLKSVYNDLPFEITGTLGPWAAFTFSQDCFFNLVGKLGKIDMTVKGFIKDVPHLRHIDLQVQAKGRDLSDLKPIVGEPLASQGPFETAFRSSDPSIQTYRVSDLKLVLDQSDLNGSADYTAVHCLVSGFNIHDGAATTTALALDTDEMSVIGEGDID
jgi:AsmA family protein